jgi:flagellum-specific peptidoglycan hydrolase FlgJ
MIRTLRFIVAAAFVAFGFSAPVARAQDSMNLRLASNDTPKPKTSKHKTAKHKTAKSSKSAKAKASKNAKKSAKRETEGKSEASGKDAGKPVQLATFGDWGAFLAKGGKEKTCYALAQPKERAPSDLKRDPAYVFISNRPGENIHNEVSIMMGFAMKDGGDAMAEVSGTSFDLISKGTNAWIKNPAQEAEFIKAMKRSAKLVVKATSVKGHTTTDSYSLAGLSQALDRVEQECQ